MEWHRMARKKTKTRKSVGVHDMEYHTEPVYLRCSKSLVEILDAWGERVDQTSRRGIAKLSRQAVARMALEYLRDAEKQGEFDPADLARKPQDDEE